ncbi:MAG: hypothetical protein AVDCRST_MAG75-227 [uncultured Propionibacteriaceae bacterium]|uniref:Ketoreductase domain-containing protein n=1 Tax=uncultured Propionibacteriaceae bacterium TaxID=257457 RepID=A0A6J4N318_9ACTN|nr:MAG: hypothetical protein AVDCRST_MAG75-227 [uncultured Propionibacteriaceae bacterium]
MTGLVGIRQEGYPFATGGTCQQDRRLPVRAVGTLAMPIAVQSKEKPVRLKRRPATDPADRVVLITGGSSGIGLAAALHAAECGNRVALLARNSDRLDVAAAQCRDRGAAEVMVLEADVADAASVDTSVQQLLTTWGKIDLIIQSAGVAGYGLFTDVPVAVFDRIIETNVLGTANVVRSALPSMRARNQGTIIMVGSIIGYIATPSMTAYTTSKWAIRGLLRTLQVENRDRPGVHICYLAPAGVDTPIYRLAANYSDRDGRPPPPVLTAQRVAAAAFQLADRPRRTAQVGSMNLLILAGFNAMPAVYDRLVSPLFRAFASRPSSAPTGHPGNAFDSS